MPDASHLFGSDLSISASGDLLTSDGSAIWTAACVAQIADKPLG